MIEELRKKLNIKIRNIQNEKEELYDKISNLDSNLLELNEILYKLNEDDAFFKMTPYEAFEILNTLGYTNSSDIYETYFKILNKDKTSTNKKENTTTLKKDEKDLDYVEKIEASHKELTKEKRKLLKKIIEVLMDNFYDDNKYYYIAKNKISKFIAYYNMASLFSYDYTKDEVIPMIVTSLCYKNIKQDNYDLVGLEIEKIRDKIEKLL